MSFFFQVTCLLKSLRILMPLTGFTAFIMSLFPLSSQPSSLCTAFDAVSFNIDRLFQSIPLLMYFSLERKFLFLSIIEFDRLVNSDIIFQSQKILLILLTFLLGFLPVMLTDILFWLWIIFVRIGMVFMIIWEIFQGKVYSNYVLLLLE